MSESVKEISKGKHRWRTWFSAQRRKLGLKRIQVAKHIGCDPSLITLIEKYGHIPRRNMVISLARVLKSDMVYNLTGYARIGKPGDGSAELILREFAEAMHSAGVKFYLQDEEGGYHDFDMEDFLQEYLKK